MTDDSLPAEVASEVASAVVPGAGLLVGPLATALIGEWRNSRSMAMKAAVRTSGLSREDLAERIAAQPELVPLVTRLLWEAAQTGQGPLLEAMGAAFGAAVHDLDRLSDYELVLAGLRGLRGEDVRLLHWCRDEGVFVPQKYGPDLVDNPLTLRAHAAREGLSEEAAASGLARLASQGFVNPRVSPYGTTNWITELGRLLFDALERMNGR